MPNYTTTILGCVIKITIYNVSFLSALKEKVIFLKLITNCVSLKSILRIAPASHFVIWNLSCNIKPELYINSLLHVKFMLYEEKVIRVSNMFIVFKGLRQFAQLRCLLFASPFSIHQVIMHYCFILQECTSMINE